MSEREVISDESLLVFHKLLHGKRSSKTNLFRTLVDTIFPVFTGLAGEDEHLSEEMINRASDFGAGIGLSNAEAAIFGAYFTGRIGQLSRKDSTKEVLPAEEDPTERLVDNLICLGLSEDLVGTQPLRRALRNAGWVAASCLASPELNIDGTKHMLAIQLADIKARRVALVQ